jgi:hypothetical protein
VKVTTRLSWAVPYAAGVILAGFVGAGTFALLATLNRPSAMDKRTAQLIGRLDRLNSSRTLITLGEYRAIPTRCTTRRRQAKIQIGDHLRLEIVNAHVRQLSGPRQPRLLLAAEAALSACPRFLASGLSGRLFAERPTLIATTRVEGRSIDEFLVSNYAHMPLVQLLVTQNNIPIAMRFISRRVRGHSQIVATWRRPSAS